MFIFIKHTSTVLISSALLAGSYFICSCDSSSTSTNTQAFFDDDGEPTTAISGLGVDPDFQTIVDRFVIEANKRNVSVDLDGLDIQYGNTNRAYGVCSFLGTNTRDIVISPELRNATDELVNEIVLHELGHCILDREHSNDPTSIMHATEIIGQPWRTSVLDELFFSR